MAYYQPTSSCNHTWYVSSKYDSFASNETWQCEPCVLRADINTIIIGERSNIQDNSTIHLENDQGVEVGNDVTVGHNVILHGCSVKDGALIGMGAIIMNGVKVGKGSIIGAGSVIMEQMIIPDYSVVVGIPGKIIKTRTEKAYQENIKWAKKYVQLSKIHKNQNWFNHFIRP